MHAAKVLILVVVGAVVVAAGVFTFVPKTRPGFVKAWFRKAQGFTPATSAEDALDKFKKALEKRDYETASLYVTGDYAEFLKKGADDAKELGKALDELRDVMKSTGVKSDKADMMLFLLEPFPASFKYEISRSEDTSKAPASLKWTEDIARFSGAPDVRDWKVHTHMRHALLPIVGVVPTLGVEVRKESEGWRVAFPVEVRGGRHVRDGVEALRKNATNYRNAIRDVKNNIKNNPAVKDQFEQELKSNLEKST